MGGWKRTLIQDLREERKNGRGPLVLLSPSASEAGLACQFRDKLSLSKLLVKEELPYSREEHTRGSEMAGQNRGRAIRASLDERGGITWLEDQLCRGRSLRSLAAEIGCGRWWLDRWVHATNERRRTVARARACGASGGRPGSATTATLSRLIGGSHPPPD